MTDSKLNQFLSRGTNAQRLAFTPSPPTPASGPSPTYLWYETDTGFLFAYDGAAWHSVAPGFVGCRAYNDGLQSIANNTATAVTFNSEEFDTSAIHSISSNTSRFTVPTGYAGKWQFSPKACFAANATGIRYMWLRKNGVDVIGATVSGVPTTAEMASMCATVTIDLVAADYVEMFVYQTSGAALNVGNLIATDRGLTCAMEARFLG
jgi:hypothetical protein